MNTERNFNSIVREVIKKYIIEKHAKTRSGIGSTKHNLKTKIHFILCHKPLFPLGKFKCQKSTNTIELLELQYGKLRY